ncbi:MAG TPA: BamA/TamA family outer membrane protein [Gemmatimonadales bacterium]|nr:BamA/TamA family outer membrane protein [Gemmatimonadales bacterium]
MLRRCGVALLLLVGTPALLSAQYFGQNKVQYKTFDWKIVQTEHFDVHYYPAERVAAMDAARMAERSYARLSRVLGHRFRERKVIILYASHSDFQQTNTTTGEVGEGTGGFTDFFKQRNIMPLTGSYADIEHVLTHEMVHQFQLDVFSHGRGGSALQGVLQVQPPLWFMEGMSEYLSLGPTTPETAMWLRDAALSDSLPTLEQLTYDPRIFPYRYGHAIWSYVGERWGDEAIGDILRGAIQGGIEASVKRVTGLSFNQLSAQWRDAVRERYLPEVGTRVRARAISEPLLTKERSDGTLHLAPAFSPDGSQIAYFSEKDWYFVDLYLADGKTGEVKRRLLKSTFSSDYETFRFINSQASFSPDGKFLAFAAKRGPRDEIAILDVARNRRVQRIAVELNGVTTPSWSPDGQQLVFTGYDGGLSDLFVVNRDGTGLRRLTEDKYADLHPVWSPDGRTIAFATDRGPETDFRTLKIGNWRIALYRLDSGSIEVLEHMDTGKNVSPQWAPDGQSIAFVSDRNGVSNVFLYDFATRNVYQLTDFFTGAQGITPLSPVLSWAPGADRLAFVYYESGRYDVYTLTNPRALRKAPYLPPRPDSATAVARAPTPAETPVVAAGPQVGPGGSIYRGPRGFRASADLGRVTDTTRFVPPVSIARLLDSATFALPDTSEFTQKDYHVSFSADYIARPSIGYVRDNFGQGIYGGSAIQLSDMLGNHNLLFAGFVNGRITEAQILAAYANLSRRLNWAVGVQQEPYFYTDLSAFVGNVPVPGEVSLVTDIRRLVFRSVFAQASYPFSRFQRLELGVRGTNVNEDVYRIVEPLNVFREVTIQQFDVDNKSYFQPSAALVFDNSLFGYTGPFAGRRYRFSAGQNIGDWRFTELLGDYRRYDRIAGPVTFATRGLFVGRIGRDEREFRIFAGIPELLRGHTSGSYRREECAAVSDPNTLTGCAALDRLVGTRIAVGSAELRFPLLTPQVFRNLPSAVPPIEAALFFDIGLAWEDGQTVKWRRDPADPVNVREPLMAYGASVRSNLFGFLILRLDYSRPLRRDLKSLWTLSLGPTF